MTRSNLTLVGCAVAGALFAQAGGPWIGTWKLNLEQSRYNPGPAPAPGTNTIFQMMPQRDGFRYTLNTTLPDGTKTHAEAFARFDGRPYPETGNPAADFNLFRRVDHRTYELLDLKDGKDALHFRISISTDGQTRTSVAEGKNAQGEPVHNVAIWDRIK